jgi:hypothetical protein
VIPDIPEIQNSLLALSLVEVSQAVPDDRCIIVCEPIRRAQRSESGEHFFQDPTALVLQQSPGAPLTIPRLGSAGSDRHARVDHRAEGSCRWVYRN